MEILKTSYQRKSASRSTGSWFQHGVLKWELSISWDQKLAEFFKFMGMAIFQQTSKNILTWCIRQLWSILKEFYFRHRLKPLREAIKIVYPDYTDFVPPRVRYMIGGAALRSAFNIARTHYKGTK